MDETPMQNQTESVVQPTVVTHKTICPQCHQPVLPTYYFCPNCGKLLEEVPLSTTFWAQLWIYAFTVVIMPLTGYLAYKHWQGITYIKSGDPKARRIGIVATVLLIATIVVVIWLTWAGTMQLRKYVEEQQSGLNGLGGFGI